ncbi:glycosyltransferase [Clostridium sp. A1-XYC3]|uniref:Glycosyltransferase n=1 Tax=Clostridium tanneri TaxID=3037988 RepID=A0ABU4JQW7_9CLOT|nr:glycosyltransferase [Clostridium sp. A1-XYC3]MDW8800546.1 glycosyltransferase [Clostridium sp. A1-XYC3]
MGDLGKRDSAIIIPCKNEGIYLKQTIDFMLKTEAKKLSDIFVIDDNSNDSCCEFLKSASKRYPNVSLIQTKGIGPSQARNLGAALASDARFLIFCDAHLTMREGWLNTMLEAFNNREVSVICPGIGHFHPNSAVGYGQNWNENLETYWLERPNSIGEIPLAPGACMIIKRDVFHAVGGFDPLFTSWGYEDVELSLKLWLFGYKIFVHPAVKVGHKFRKVQPYNVNIVDFHYNKLRIAIIHFNKARVKKLIKLMNDYPHFEKIIEKIKISNSHEHRKNYFRRRIYDDNWFFNKFNIPF